MQARWRESFEELSGHHELYSYGKGFKLNEFSYPALYQINQELGFNPNFVSYGSNHIHVDKLDEGISAAQFSIINFRRANYEDGAPYNKGWEACDVPFAKSQHPPLINNIESLFFDTASFYNQIQIINGLYDIEVKDKDLTEFYKLLNNKDKEQIQLTPKNFSSLKSQDLLSKFYLFIAKKYQREDLIPHILRAWKNLQLPNLSLKVYEKLFALQNLPPRRKTDYSSLLNLVFNLNPEPRHIARLIDNVTQTLDPVKSIKEQELLSLYHGYNVYEQEHPGKGDEYPDLNDLKNIIHEVPGFERIIGYIDCKHPAIQSYFKKYLPPRTYSQSGIQPKPLGDYARALYKRIEKLSPNIKFGNLPSSSNLEASLFRLCLLMQRRIHVSEISLEQILNDFLKITYLVPDFILDLNKERNLLDDLDKVKTENHQLDFSNYINLYENIIKYNNIVASNPNLSPVLELAKIKTIITNKLLVGNLDTKQITELEKTAIQSSVKNNFDIDKFYLIDAGKLKLENKIKLQDDNLKLFLKELSSSNLVSQNLVNYIEEFDFTELKNFILENKDISMDNIAELVKKLKPSRITYAEAEPYVTSYAVHPQVRSTIFRLIDPQSLKVRTQQGHISVKC